MKKTKTLTAIILAAALLCGCAGPVEAGRGLKKGIEAAETVTDKLENGLLKLLRGVFGEDFLDPYAERRRAREENIVPFGEMEYMRPDVEKMSDDVSALEDALEEGKASLDRIMELIDACYDDYYDFSTMRALADVRNCLDLSDEFYAQEYVWCEEQGAVVSDLIDEMYYACGSSKYARRLERNYFWSGFADEYADISDSMYSDEMVRLMQRESDLNAQYREVVAEATVVYGGKELSFDDALELAQERLVSEGYTDEAFENYYDTLCSYYRKYNPVIGDIFIELVKVRKAMAEEADWDSYEQMQYGFYYERDFTPEQASEFVESVEEYMVPLYRELDESTDTRGGTYSSMRSGRLKNCVWQVALEFGGVMKEAFDFMEYYDLYDFSVSKNKTPMSFQTYFDNYEAPFLLISAEGNTSDIINAVHEFGHYTDCYANFNAWESVDLAECFSQGLEYLALDILRDELGDDELSLIAQKQARDAVNTFVQQCSLAEFEHAVYSLPEDELTLDKINEIYLELTERFGYAEAGLEEYYSMCWIDIPHFFQAPFYVISYPVSLAVALQFYVLESAEPGSGREKYLELLGHSSGNLLETVDDYGLDDPFERETMEKTAEVIRKMYKEYK